MRSHKLHEYPRPPNKKKDINNRHREYFYVNRDKIAISVPSYNKDSV